MRKIIKILVFIFLSNLIACSNNQNPNLDTETNSNGIISFKNIEFNSQGATLRGRLYLPDSKSKKNQLL